MSGRRGIVLLPLLVLAGCSTARTPLSRAADYLWRQQAPDGGWHSATYGLLRSGQALTPFALDALIGMPDEPAGGIDRAVAFISRNTRRDGALGLAEDIPDYPNYATALAVIALTRAGRRGPVGRMVEYLRSQQFTAQNGWHPQDRAYGAWGMGGERRTPPETGHVDLSMTRYVVEALRAAGAPASDPALIAARVFIERCQNANGGFFFTTTEFDTNKAGMDGDRFRSYGTTTADGIIALLAAGVAKDDRHIEMARRWLTDNHKGFFVPGFVGESRQRWPRGLSFYYAAASMQAFRALGVDSGSGVREVLLRTQRPDGSWANSENLVKEDDPLIATAFAIRALR